VVLNKQTIDAEVMRRVAKVAMDTSRGQTLDIIRLLHKHGEEGLPMGAILVQSRAGDGETKRLMKFLRHIGAVQYFRLPTVNGIKGNDHWRLTPKLVTLYEGLQGHSHV